jgi:hypothetical protein
MRIQVLIAYDMESQWQDRFPETSNRFRPIATRLAHVLAAQILAGDMNQDWPLLRNTPLARVADPPDAYAEAAGASALGVIRPDARSRMVK